MTKSKKTKKALLASVLSIMLCVAMLAGTTFAWFTDTAGSDNNRVKSGNLRINLLGRTQGETYDDELAYGEISDNGKLFADTLKWEPGQVYYRELKVVNEGNLAAKFSVDIDDREDAFKFNYRLDPALNEDGTIAYTCTEHSLTDVVEVAVYKGTFEELVAKVNENIGTLRGMLTSKIEKLEGELGGLEGASEVDLSKLQKEMDDIWKEMEPLLEELDELYEDEEGNAEEIAALEEILADLDEQYAAAEEKYNAALGELPEGIRNEINELKGSIEGAKAKIEEWEEELLDPDTSKDNAQVLKAWIEGAQKEIEDWQEKLDKLQTPDAEDSTDKEEKERELQESRDLLKSLESHPNGYDESDRDVVKAALLLDAEGEEPIFETADAFVSGGSALLEGKLAPKGDTERGLGDEQVFTLIAYWAEDGEADNDYNLKNGRMATELMDAEKAAKTLAAAKASGKYNGEVSEKELKIEFDILVLATQAEYEDDTFGSDYDAEATWGATAATTKP